MYIFYKGDTLFDSSAVIVKYVILVKIRVPKEVCVRVLRHEKRSCGDDGKVSTEDSLAIHGERNWIPKISG